MPADLRRATQVFETYVPKSFQIDLNDLSTRALVARAVAERLRRRDRDQTLRRPDLRARDNEPEDISFFDRRRHRNISVYRVAETKLAARGRFFSEDEQLDYDITPLRHRRRVRAGAAVGRRHARDWRSDAHALPCDADAAPGRAAGRAQRHLAASSAGCCTCGSSARTTSSIDFPASVAARHGPRADDHLRRAAASRRRSIARRSNLQEQEPRASAKRSSCPWSRSSSTAIAATGIRRRRSPTTRRRC